MTLPAIGEYFSLSQHALYWFIISIQIRIKRITFFNLTSWSTVVRFFTDSLLSRSVILYTRQTVSRTADSVSYCYGQKDLTFFNRLTALARTSGSTVDRFTHDRLSDCNSVFFSLSRTANIVSTWHIASIYAIVPEFYQIVGGKCDKYSGK